MVWSDGSPKAIAILLFVQSFALRIETLVDTVMFTIASSDTRARIHSADCQNIHIQCGVPVDLLNSTFSYFYGANLNVSVNSSRRRSPQI